MVTIKHQTDYTVPHLFIRLVFWVIEVSFRFWDSFMSHIEGLQSFVMDVLKGNWFPWWRGALTLTASEEEELKESLSERNRCQFKTLMRHHGRYFYSIAYSVKCPHGNILEEILNIPSSEVADQFYQVLVMEVPARQMRKLMEDANLPQYISTHNHLVIKLRDHYQTLGTRMGKLLKLAINQIQLQSHLIRCMFLLPYLIEIGKLLLLGELVHMSDVLFFCGLAYLLYHRSNCIERFSREYGPKQTVRVAAQIDTESYFTLVKIINDLHWIDNILISCSTGISIFIAALMINCNLCSLKHQPEHLDPLFQTTHFIFQILKWCSPFILVIIDRLVLTKYVVRLSDIMFPDTKTVSHNPLVGAKPEIVIKHLDEFREESKLQFWQRNLLTSLRTQPDIYKHLLSNRDYSDEERRLIKEKLKMLSILPSDYSFKPQIISEFSRVHVVAMSANKNRVDAAQEKQHITQMCDKMGYTLHGPFDVGHSADFIEMLEDTLRRIRSENPELILVFIMGHGQGGKIFGHEGDGGVQITKLITIANENTPDHILKFMYLQACRSTTAENRILCTDSDPQADDSLVPTEYKSISYLLESCKNMYVHMATPPGEVAFQNTFIHYISHHLSSTSSLFIKPHDVSVAVNRECSSFFSEPQLYASPKMNAACEIRVPNRVI